jgi:hypothetical protein
MRTRKWRDRAIAGGVVLGWHALAGWWLLHGMRLPVDTGNAGDLEVVYVSLPPRSSHQATPSPVRRPSRAPRPMQRRQVRAPVAASAPASAPLSVVVLGQAHDYAVAAPPLPVAPRDPFADRPSPLHPQARNRIRMAAPVTVATVLVDIGKVIGGPGYEADPCPRNSRNLNDLLAAGDSKRLRMAIEYDRDHCRP